MKKLNWDFIIGIGYICFWIGLMWADVGKPAHVEVTQWYHVPILAGTLLIPFITGFQAGRKHERGVSMARDIPRPVEFDAEIMNAFTKFCNEEGINIDDVDDWLPWWECWYDGFINGRK
jgi:hypothetical protein